MAKTQTSKVHLNPRRFAGLLGVVLVFSIAGAYFLRSSNAATPTYHQILNYTSRSQTSGVSDVQAPVNSIGQQTVSQIVPGAQLDYQTGGKIAIKSQCYTYTVVPSSSGGQTAKIQFVGQGSSVTVNVTYSPDNAGFWRRTCVTSGTQTPKGFNVANLSPSDGPSVLVYQDDVSF